MELDNLHKFLIAFGIFLILVVISNMPQAEKGITSTGEVIYHSENLETDYVANSKVDSENNEKLIEKVIEEEAEKPADKYVCSSNIYNCADFNSHSEAQEAFEYCGASRDIHDLDRDNDGLACEALPW